MENESGPFTHPKSVGEGLRLSATEAAVIAEITALIGKEVPTGLSDWVSISASFYLAANERGVGNSCYAYDRLGYSGGFTVDNVDKKPLLMRLREVHGSYPQQKWIKVLFQFGRAEEQLIVTYEFEDAYRWNVTTDNYRTAIRAIRADFGEPAEAS
jgi:hypothetical protein